MVLRFVAQNPVARVVLEGDQCGERGAEHDHRHDGRHEHLDEREALFAAEARHPVTGPTAGLDSVIDLLTAVTQ